ncbi:hypothetical protein ACFO1B_31740 [Dactylosporangium siamense]|uniref:Uncharacterized protein n=1 Tax=Dactylosporangium siamense TaxID=685454 RepID=A0A919PR25_9ACTN|nr:hypothetical protein [Dactylosporangium siamense]GIG48667.1 hypothetical protein Dsi01nite_067080 [Dactylosporangium siamense]
MGETSLDLVIDLDVAEDRPGPSVPPWRRLAAKRVPTGMLVLVGLVSLLAGAVAGQRWEAGRQRDREVSEVSLHLSVAGMGSASGGSGRFVVEGTVAVANGGPRTIELLGAEKPADVMVWGHRRIPPGATAWLAVSATITCGEGAGSMPLPVELPVMTQDGVQRTAKAQLPLVGSAWQQYVVQGCALPR